MEDKIIKGEDKKEDLKTPVVEKNSQKTPERNEIKELQKQLNELKKTIESNKASNSDKREILEGLRKEDSEALTKQELMRMLQDGTIDKVVESDEETVDQPKTFVSSKLGLMIVMRPKTTRFEPFRKRDIDVPGKRIKFVNGYYATNVVSEIKFLENYAKTRSGVFSVSKDQELLAKALKKVKDDKASGADKVNDILSKQGASAGSQGLVSGG